VKSSSQIVAYASGGCAHLYLNIRGREVRGVVEPSDAEAVVRAAAAHLAGAQVDGQDVVQAMFRRAELAGIGLDSPNAGDLVVFLRPGFNGSSEIGPPGAPFHAQAELYGAHGFLNTTPAMAAVWLARGAAVPARHISKASLTEVAAFVAQVAGVQPPARARR
jgi:predicted AlkP superfamily phosphohydrolase/phosphomutase